MVLIPFVSRKKHDALLNDHNVLLSDYAEKESHYWKQASLNLTAQKRIRDLESLVEQLREKLK